MDLEDQLRSVNRMLWLLFTSRTSDPAGFRIELQRVRKLQRPMIRLERTAERTKDFGSGLFQDECQYAITYYGSDRTDVDKTVATIKRYIDQGGTDYSNLNLIQGWRFGWAFPQPLDLGSRADVVGTIPTGTYQVRISGTDHCGNESAASVAASVTLTGPNNIYLRVPRVPWNSPLFPSYSVYVNGHLETTVAMPRWGYPSFTLTSLLGTGIAPKETVDNAGVLNTVRWRWLRVTRFSSNTREDTLNNGVWQSTITLETSFLQPRDVPQTDVIGYIRVQDVVQQIATPALSSFVVQVGTP
jgi:hypothetical protein